VEIQQQRGVVEGKDAQDTARIEIAERSPGSANVQQNASNQKPGQNKKQIDPGPAETGDVQDEGMDVPGSEGSGMKDNHRQDRQTSNAIEFRNVGS
jgi:hypothetical protein